LTTGGRRAAQGPICRDFRLAVCPRLVY